MAEIASGTEPNRAQRLVERIALFFASIGVVLFSTAVIYTVSARYLFHKTPYWSEEVPRFLLVWVTFLGVAAATSRRSHLSAGILPLIVRDPGLCRRIGLLADACTIGFLAVAGWTGWELAGRTWASLTTALQIPMAWTYLALPVSAVLAVAAALFGLRGR